MWCWPSEKGKGSSLPPCEVMSQAIAPPLQQHFNTQDALFLSSIIANASKLTWHLQTLVASLEEPEILFWRTGDTLLHPFFHWMQIRMTTVFFRCRKRSSGFWHGDLVSMHECTWALAQRGHRASGLSTLFHIRCLEMQSPRAKPTCAPWNTLRYRLKAPGAKVWEDKSLSGVLSVVVFSYCLWFISLHSGEYFSLDKNQYENKVTSFLSVESKW